MRPCARSFSGRVGLDVHGPVDRGDTAVAAS
jgi:hypothetical protein